MLSVIGIGPGSQAMMTMEAVEALQAAEIVVGYKTYTHLVKAFTGDKQVIKTGMCKEIERCQAAIELAQAGHNVALISSGDAGIYGMAGLVLELVNKQQLDIEVRLIPGMTASIAAASLLGGASGVVAGLVDDEAVRSDPCGVHLVRAAFAEQHRRPPGLSQPGRGGESQGEQGSQEFAHGSSLFVILKSCGSRR